MKYISICIILTNGPEKLPRCLDSIGTQDFDDYEVIIVDSTGYRFTLEMEEQLSGIADCYGKSHGMDIRYAFVPSEYGKLEAVRKAVMKADGLYFLMLEPGDILCTGALSSLHDISNPDHPDIVQGNIRCNMIPEPDAQEDSDVMDGLERLEKLVNAGRKGLLLEDDILDEFLSAGSSRGCLMGRIMRTELMLSSLSMLPVQYAVHGYDYLIYFSVAYLARSFLGTDLDVYEMNIGEDVSTERRISSLRDWEQICLASSLYSSIYGLLKRFGKDLTDEEYVRIEEQSYFHLVQGIIDLEKSVSEEMRPQAWEMLRSFWGDDVFDSVLVDLCNKGILDLKSWDFPLSFDADMTSDGYNMIN